MSQDPYALRYGTTEPSAPHLPRNAVLDQILDHRSVRAFLPDPLAPEVLPTLVAAAQSAASYANVHWSRRTANRLARVESLSEAVRRLGFRFD